MTGREMNNLKWELNCVTNSQAKKNHEENEGTFHNETQNRNNNKNSRKAVIRWWNIIDAIKRFLKCDCPCKWTGTRLIKLATLLRRDLDSKSKSNTSHKNEKKKTLLKKFIPFTWITYFYNINNTLKLGEVLNVFHYNAILFYWLSNLLFYVDIYSLHYINFFIFRYIWG